MWITVENTRKCGDIELGISKLKVKGSGVFGSYPHLSPQVFTKIVNMVSSLVRKVTCNYKKVIQVTHLLTPVITTNFKYKFSIRDSAGSNIKTLNRLDERVCVAP